MTKAHSTKPAKPYPDFPLFPHATKRWAKKINGRTCYFGSWADGWQKALDKYQRERDDLYAGRTPRPEGTLTVADLVNRFLTSKKLLVDTRELTPTTFRDYHDVCKVLINGFGNHRAVDDLRPDDFEQLRAQLAKTLGPVRLGNTIQRIRCVFKYGYDNSLIDKPIRYGQGFKKPSVRTLRVHRQASGENCFTADEIRRLIEEASVPLRAMILLGINGGFGNSDCARLPRSAVDLATYWADYPRPKTGVDRRCPLWPETIAAIKAALASRPMSKNPEDADLIFVTRTGGRWVRECKLPQGGSEPAERGEKGAADNVVAKEFAKLIKKLQINGRRRLGFYSLRHTFETIGGDSRDQVAVNHLMGHADVSMAGNYREWIADERLKAVTDHIRGWLWPEVQKNSMTPPG